MHTKNLNRNLAFRTIGFLSLLLVALFGLSSRSGTAQTPVTPTPPIAVDAWSINGALSETCTCNVPCTCNFGQGPSPHHYCYSFFSYHIRSGKYGSVSLDGLHFGAADLANKRTFFIDEKADANQRAALKLIIARVIQKSSTAEAAKTVGEITPNIQFVAVKQVYDDRHNRLEVAGLGEFAADYIMGLDKAQPVIVHNNSTWRIADAIKAKTTLFRVHAGRDTINTSATNSNQGDFTYTDRTDFGSHAAWSCGSQMSGTSKVVSSDPMCGAGK